MRSVGNQGGLGGLGNIDGTGGVGGVGGVGGPGHPGGQGGQGGAGGPGQTGGLGGLGGIGGHGEDGTIGGTGGTGGVGGVSSRKVTNGNGNGTRWAVRLSIVLILAVFLATSIVAIVSIMQTDEPPVTFEKAIISNPIVCGDIITYDVRIRYHKIPVIAISTRTVFDIDNQKTVIWDTAPRHTIMTGARVYEVTQVYVLSAHLPPGHYELRVATSTSTSNPSIVVMPFTVPVDCPK
jgi:uncharacterized membrane protein YhdT